MYKLLFYSETLSGQAARCNSLYIAASGVIVVGLRDITLLLYPDIVLRLTRVSDAVMDDGVTLLTTDCGDYSVSGLHRVR